MLQIIFTKSNKIGSKLIMALTKEPVSHCAIRWEDLIIHSSFGGIRIDFLNEFLENNEIIYQTDINFDINKISNLKPAPYDYAGLLYLGARFLLKSIGIKLPRKNLWQCTGMYMCTEFITKELTGEENSLITPFKLYQELSKKG